MPDIDNMHAHHLVEKAGAGNPENAMANKAIIEEVGFNSKLSRENLAWARNVAGQHGGERQGILRARLEPVHGNKEAIIEALKL